MTGLRAEDLRVRQYEPRDHEAVVGLHFTALAGAGALGPRGPWDDDLDDVAGVYVDAGGDFLVGDVDGAIVAMGAIKRTTESRAEVKRMRVANHLHRRGFGRAILDALERRAVELGYRELHLDTTTRQVAAVGLYTACGFREVRHATVGEWELVYFEKALLQ